MSKTFEIVSIGKACEILQRGPEAIRETARALGIEPAARINLVDHYDSEQLQQIGKRLREGVGNA